MPKPLPTPDELRKILIYRPQSGKLFWRERPVEMFANNIRGKEVMSKA